MSQAQFSMHLSSLCFERTLSINKSINQSKTLFNFEFVVDSNIADISEENKSMK